MTLPITTGAVATHQAVQLNIFVEESEWKGKFNTLEVWRSRVSSAGPYYRLNGDMWLPARIPEVYGDPPEVPEVGASVNISGRILNLLVNETTPIDITFVGPDPRTLQQIAVQIQNGSLGFLRSFVLLGNLVIETLQAGARASLRIVGGDAAALLGLPMEEPESIDFGLDARLGLVDGVVDYTFLDLNGGSDFYYKTRFYNTQNQTSSEYGLPFPGKSIASVSRQSLVRGFADFVGANGRARANQEVIVHTSTNGLMVEGKVVVPTSPTRLLSDSDGHVELEVIRGTKLSIALSGTDIVRDIEAPMDLAITSFNLLDPTKGKNDVFKVQVPEYDFASRRSL